MGPNNPQDIQQPGQTFGPGSQSPSYQTPTPPSPQQAPSSPGSGSDNKTKKIMIGIGVLVAIFVLIVVVVLISGGGKKKQAENTDQTTQTESLIKEPTAIDVENVNNSISDDISNLSTDNDFPAGNLSDEKLEL